MYFHQSFLLYFLLFLSCVNTGNSNSHQDISQIVQNWNKATVLSLKNRELSTSDTSQRSAYKNRLLAFEAYIGMKDKKNDHNSIRYLLLKEILSKNNGNKGDFYIIEANSSGESVEIRSYVISPYANNESYVDVYRYGSNKWIKNSNSKKLSFHLDSDLKKYVTKFGLGFNQDDVIISQFNNDTVRVSEYYLYGTLSSKSGIKRIL